jgi:hypothetical protein
MRARWLLILGSLSVLAGTGQARTITLTAEDCDQIAIIAAKAPLMSWALAVNVATYNTEPSLQIFPEMSVLLRYPLDRIPKGQRITKAELTLTADYVASSPQLTVRRLLAQWGHGVCYKYRQTFPRKEEWAKPGGLGASTDRAGRDTAVFRMEKTGDHTVDVTEDVELWYTGGAANRGWILAIENGGIVYMGSPYAPHHETAKHWKLTITFEPP